jgi:hypothetical protein
MGLRQFALALGMVLCSSGIAHAEDTGQEKKDIELIQPFAHIFTDETVSLLFDHLRHSLRSAAQGKPAPKPPAELVKRMQEAGETLRRESANAAIGMLDEAERQMRETLREHDGTRL